MMTQLTVYAISTAGVLLVGLAHLFFPEAMARFWRRGGEVDAQRRWAMQRRGAIALGIGFFLCWILVEAGGILRYLVAP